MLNDFNSVEEKVIYEKLISYKSNDDSRKTVEDMPNEYNEIMAGVNRCKTVTMLASVDTNYKGIVGKMVILIKKIIRKCTRWLFMPLILQQNAYNEYVAKSLGGLLEVKFRMENEINDLKKNNVNYQQKTDDLFIKCQEVQNEIVLLHNENEKIYDVSSTLEKIVQSDIKLSDSYWLSRETFSQSGEDIIIDYIFMVKGIDYKKCKYLDLGANHAKELSNTYSLYRKGARGVLLEANPQLIPELKLYRSEDCILNRCISRKTGENAKFYVLSGDGLSSMDKAAVDDCIAKNPSIEIQQVLDVTTISIGDIFEEYFVEAPDVLNIDIEGLEVEILKQINFSQYRPFIIICEMIEYQPTIVCGEKNQEIIDFMIENRYKEYAFTGINSIFVDMDRM